MREACFPRLRTPTSRHGHRRQAWLWAALWACAACGGGSPPPVTAPPASRPPPRPQAAASDNPRVFAPGATVADLVTRIEELDGLGKEEGTAACLLGKSAQGFQLPVDLEVAVRPPPPAPEDLDAHVEQASGLSVLNTYGKQGHGDFVVTQLTAAPPGHAASALVLTDRGAYLLDGSRTPWKTGPSPLQDLAGALEERADAPKRATLYVVAEAGLPLSTLHATLWALNPLGMPVSLGSALPPGTRLPEPPEPVAGSPAHCPGGLPAAPDALAGELMPEAARKALAPFLEAARTCATQSAAAASGGRIVMALRVDADGLVSERCLVEDGVGDPELARCLQRAAASLRFPAPKGHVDLHVPLQLQPVSLDLVQPACEG